MESTEIKVKPAAIYGGVWTDDVIRFSRVHIDKFRPIFREAFNSDPAIKRAITVASYRRFIGSGANIDFMFSAYKSRSLPDRDYLEISRLNVELLVADLNASASHAYVRSKGDRTKGDNVVFSLQRYFSMTVICARSEGIVGSQRLRRYGVMLPFDPASRRRLDAPSLPAPG